MSKMNNPADRDYGIVFTPAAERDLDRIEKSDKKALLKIDAKIMGLSRDPRPNGVDKLSGHINRYRIRSGDYRIIYSVEDAARTITLQTISNRRDVYRQH